MSLTVEDTEYVRVSLAPTGKKAGEGLLRIEADDQVYGLKLAYENYVVKKYQGRQVATGTFILSLYDPENRLSTGMEGSPFPDIFDSTLALTCDVQGEALNAVITANLKGLGMLKLSSSAVYEAGAMVTLPEVGENNAFMLDLSDPAPQYHTMSELNEEYALGVMKHLQKLMGESAELAALLEKMGVTAGQLESGISWYENGYMQDDSCAIPDYSYGESAAADNTPNFQEGSCVPPAEPGVNTIEDYVACVQEEFDRHAASRADNGLSLKVSASGNSVVYTYRFIIELQNAAMVGNSLAGSLDAMAPAFQADLAALQRDIPEIESVIVKYYDLHGNQLASKEFRTAPSVFC